MSVTGSTGISKRLHAIVAVVFLFVMLVEWGSHSLAFVHHAEVSGMVSIGVGEVEHDDPCRTLTCCEGRKDGQSAPGFPHHLLTYNSYAEVSDQTPSFRHDPGIPAPSRDDVRRIFRPKDPLLHPPEFS